MELLLLQHVSLSGKILSYNPAVHMLGAENRGNVTCYLDALLFAMFAKLESFECMLKGDSMDEPQRKLAALLRLWVNMLRSGKLIETDMVSISFSSNAKLFTTKLIIGRPSTFRTPWLHVAGEMHSY